MKPNRTFKITLVLVLLLGVVANARASQSMNGLSSVGSAGTLPADSGRVGSSVRAAPMPQGNSPNLAIPDQILASPGGQVTLPVNYTANGNDISTVAFSIDYDETWLDPDSDDDGVLDNITPNLPAEFGISIFFDDSDTNGEIDFYIADAFPPLSSLPDYTTLVSITFDVGNPTSTMDAKVRLSQAPPASFGSTTGQSVPGITSDGSVLIVVDKICHVQGMSISPASPAGDDDDLTLSYQCLDFGGTPIDDTIARWYRNGQLQPAFNDQTVIPSTVTSAVETWCATVTPYDGNEYGTSETKCVDIEQKPNTPPTAEVSINPPAPLDNQELQLLYTYDDKDGDPEDTNQTQKRWYRNGKLAPRYNNQDTVPTSDTLPGDTWCTTVQPGDGKDYGPISEQYCVAIGTTTNHLPRANNPTLGAPIQTSGGKVTLTYDYFDADGDPEVPSEAKIRWYRDSQLEPVFNNAREVPEDVTLPGDVWHAMVQPHDGKGLGVKGQTKPVLVKSGSANTPPMVSDIYIIPSEPGVNHFLRLYYTFIDVDGDIEGDTQIYWFKDQVRQTDYDGQTIVPASATSVGEVWFALVIPHDGQAYGLPETGYSVTIRGDTGNTPPVICDAYLSPAQPGDDSILEVFYEYFDDDGDLEGPTQIRWTIDGVAQPALDDLTVIEPYLTGLGQEWCATVTPHDGKDAGDTVSAGCVTIGATSTNNPPEAIHPHIEPPVPASFEILGLVYEFNDQDSDPEGDSDIRWYKIDSGGGAAIEQAGYRGQTKIPSTATLSGEQWYATIRPHDGTEYGPEKQTAIVRINCPPQVSNVQIAPAQPSTDQDLAVTYDYYDPDNPGGDPTSEISTRWFRDGAHISDYDGPIRLPFTATLQGEQWAVAVMPHDGIEPGQEVTSTAVTIGPSGEVESAFLPIVVRSQETPDCTPPSFYEENDNRAQACGPIVSGQSHEPIYPNDTDDYFYFELNETVSVNVQVTNYAATEPGQLILYGWIVNKFIAYEPYLQGTGGIPNGWYPGPIILAPGKYYVRVYTYPGTFNTTTAYQLVVTLNPAGCRGCQ